MSRDLWHERREEARRRVEPLAVRMRPRSLDEVAGQQHILGPGKLLRRMLDADALTSAIFHGPPGTGKTTLAEVVAHHTRRVFVSENAAAVGVARIREILHEASRLVADTQQRTVLFLDEIHRFTRAQQDVLLGDVERGLVTLIGATTENPLFAINSALVSRSTLFRFEPLSEEDIIAVLRRAMADPERGYGRLDLRVDDEALRVWAIKSDGDARRALTALEVAVLSAPRPVAGAGTGAGPLHITREDAEDSIQQKAAVYDAAGDQHYDHASAMIKSVRGGDPDAAIYWIARMLEAGEDPRFIARRLAILASEDIGNADPRALGVASAAWTITERIGMPECRITLSQAAAYLALAPKSNASYLAIDAAMRDVREGRTVAVPAAIKDGNVRRASQRSSGSVLRDAEGYRYAHDEAMPAEARAAAELGALGLQDYLGVDRAYYNPAGHGFEKILAERLADVRRLRGRGTGGGAGAVPGALPDEAGEQGRGEPET